LPTSVFDQAGIGSFWAFAWRLDIRRESFQYFVKIRFRQVAINTSGEVFVQLCHLLGLKHLFEFIERDHFVSFLGLAGVVATLAETC
jgi:hypothetical protein